MHFGVEAATSHILFSIITQLKSPWVTFIKCLTRSPISVQLYWTANWWNASQMWNAVNKKRNLIQLKTVFMNAIVRA